MTSEICLMNRYAAVLAADSATTSSHWDPVERRATPRYFKGANKIFQLSSFQPVGVMIYDTAALHGVPWEIIIKDFRAHLKDRVYDRIADYAAAFFEFVKTQTILFPLDHFDSLLIESAKLVAYSVCYRAQHDPRVISKKDAPSADLVAAYKEAFADQVAEINASPLPSHFTEDDLNGAVAAHGPAVSAAIAKSNLLPVTSGLNVADVADASIRILFRNYNLGILNMTGIVVAGFGEKDVFPGYCEYACYGFMGEKLLVDEVSTAQIDFEKTAEIKAFAVTSMTDTFEMGFSNDVYNKIRACTHDVLREFAQIILKEVGSPKLPNLEAHIKQLEEKHRLAWIDEAFSSHRWPLHRVIGSLPINEMANLGETLIMLQSLKEKVTQPSESVSGPIDVAAITKGDGFVWVKRKHYFDPSLNPRYFQRQRTQYEQ
jgi:hypothetical protein